jgi:hypothetical protein
VESLAIDPAKRRYAVEESKKQLAEADLAVLDASESECVAGGAAGVLSEKIYLRIGIPVDPWFAVDLGGPRGPLGGGFPQGILEELQFDLAIR